MSRFVAQGLTPDSFKNMVIDAGAAFVDLDLKGGETAEECIAEMEKALGDGRCLGATTGAFAFDFGYESRGIEADGKKFEFVGSTVIDAVNASVSTTLKEVTQGNLMRVIPTAVYDNATKSIGITMAYTDDSYLENLWVILNRNDGAYIGIKLQNALNTEGAPIQTNDKGEAEISVTFKGHQASLTDSQFAPARIYFFEPAARVRLDSLMIGPLALSPAFNSSVTNYTATTTNATNTITATSSDTATIDMSVDGTPLTVVPTTSGGTLTATATATWSTGSINRLEITVTDAAGAITYTIDVDAQ